MAVNLSTKSADKLTRRSALKHSVIAGSFDDNYSFKGAKTIEIITPVSQPLNDYQRSGSNRYGTPTELQDVKQELTLTKDKSWSMTIDKGNLQDQNYLKKAGECVEMQQEERVIPEYDKHALEILATKAGTIVAAAAALDKSNVVAEIIKAGAALDDKEIPSENRTLFVPSEVYALIKLSPEFTGLEKLGNRAISKGTVGMFDNMRTVKVPASRWPKNVNFIIVHKKSWTAPKKIHEAKIHKDPPGISGNLLEGRDYFDAFVLGARASGAYCQVKNGQTVLAAPTIAAATGAVTGASGATVYHTTDGSDPRYSATRQTGSPVAVTAGMVVKAYATKAGAWDSPVAEATITA